MSKQIVVNTYDLVNMAGEHRTEYGVRLAHNFKSQKDAENYAAVLAAAPEMLNGLKVAVMRLEEIRYQIAIDKAINFLKEIITKAEART